MADDDTASAFDTAGTDRIAGAPPRASPRARSAVPADRLVWPNLRMLRVISAKHS